MANNTIWKPKKVISLSLLLLACTFSTSFFPPEPPTAPAPREPELRTSNFKPETPFCSPNAQPFYGYTFLHPEIINKNAAYAPFFLRWDDYYQRFYFDRDIQKQENVQEWIERFCGQPLLADVEKVVYKSDINTLIGLRNCALDKGQKASLPYALGGNTFAEMLAVNGCTEVVDYLMFAQKCEPYVIPNGNGWGLDVRDPEAMQMLIDEGQNRLLETKSHFIRLRYAYQIIRLAHYKRDWRYTVELYNYLMPKIDRRKQSIIFYWIVGHVAGAMQQLGQYPEAAYRFSLVFRHCASKRTQAYRSFLIRNDQDWEKTLRLCQTDGERATLYILRAGGSHTYATEDMATIYKLDPTNPQLDLLLVSDVQELEKIYLRTRVTDKKRGTAEGVIQREKAAKHLLDLQSFVSQVLKDAQTPNLKLWRGMAGYLLLLAGDRYGAEKTFDRVERSLDEDQEYEGQLYHQIQVWRVLLQIMNLDPSVAYIDDKAFRIRSLEAFQSNPNFEPFLEDWLSEAYTASRNPGKAILAAYTPNALRYNPRFDVLDDLLRVADSYNPEFLEYAMQIDTNPARIRAFLLEIKGAYLLGQGEPEAALAVMRTIAPAEQVRMSNFSPFKEIFGERIHRPVTDTLLLNRIEIARKLLDYQFRAKAAEAVDAAEAAWYNYLLGLGYYNMSYFGYEWEAADFYRSGYNQLRLAQGPIFSLDGSPDGNRENTDVSLALSYFEKAMRLAKTPEMAARATFMAARCQQKQYFVSKDGNYRPGSRLIPSLPDEYRSNYDILQSRYSNTEFYGQIVKECKWLAAYARR